MQRLSWGRILIGGIFLALSALESREAWAQRDFSNGYEDYGAFANDPVDLDQEYQDTFGRFFQTSFLVGTGLFTGNLAANYSAGVHVGVRFVYYFDKMWATELGIAFARHEALYEGTNLFLNLVSNHIPITLGFRYAFDPENLPRGFSMMHPFLAAGITLDFRSEAVSGTPITGAMSPPSLGQTKWTTGAINADQTLGFNLGGGFEFDVYRRKLFLGLDLRYHFMYWPDRLDIFDSSKNLDRSGDYITLLGLASYNY